LKNIGLILFDIDGVIRSVENSYRLSLKKTVYKFSGWEPSYIDIDNAKNEGIWNNDWDLSLELIKRYIKKENLNLKIPPREEIVKCFEKFYFGGDPNKDSKYWSGYITNEELLVDKKFFDLIQDNGIIWGFVSGAESASAKFVLEKRLGLKSPPLISMGDAPDKPDPKGFINLFDDYLATDLFEKVDKPIQLIWGEKDPWESLNEAQEWKKKFKTIKKLDVVKDAGHCPHDEDPETTNKLIYDFLQETK